MRRAVPDWTENGLTTALDGTRSTVKRALEWLVETEHFCYKTAGGPNTPATYRAEKCSSGLRQGL